MSTRRVAGARLDGFAGRVSISFSPHAIGNASHFRCLWSWESPPTPPFEQLALWPFTRRRLPNDKESNEEAARLSRSPVARLVGGLRRFRLGLVAGNRVPPFLPPLPVCMGRLAKSHIHLLCAAHGYDELPFLSHPWVFTLQKNVSFLFFLSLSQPGPVVKSLGCGGWGSHCQSDVRLCSRGAPKSSMSSPSRR